MKELIKNIIKIIYIPFNFYKAKIFVISFQRTGTTSTGEFFKKHGYKVANYGTARKNDWTLKWFTGNFNSIFNSIDFKFHQVFEDDPWWCLDFYKYLFHRFPNSKFVLLERDADKWFDSMVSHSDGQTLGNTYRHSKLYHREEEFYKLEEMPDVFFSNVIDNKLPLNETHREHYQKLYKLRNREINEFFKEMGKNRFICLRLEDPRKWKKIGDFFNFNVRSDFEIHANKSSK